jgi:hypothetical protein
MGKSNAGGTSRNHLEYGKLRFLQRVCAVAQRLYLRYMAVQPLTVHNVLRSEKLSHEGVLARVNLLG